MRASLHHSGSEAPSTVCPKRLISPSVSAGSTTTSMSDDFPCGREPSSTKAQTGRSRFAGSCCAGRGFAASTDPIVVSADRRVEVPRRSAARSAIASAPPSAASQDGLTTPASPARSSCCAAVASSGGGEVRRESPHPVRMMSKATKAVVLIICLIPSGAILDVVGPVGRGSGRIGSGA